MVWEKCENKNKLQTLSITTTLAPAPTLETVQKKSRAHRMECTEQKASAWRQSINFMTIITQIEVNLLSRNFFYEPNAPLSCACSAYRFRSKCRLTKKKKEERNIVELPNFAARCARALVLEKLHAQFFVLHM